MLYLVAIKEVGNLVYNTFERICTEAVRQVRVAVQTDQLKLVLEFDYRLSTNRVES